MFCPKCGTQNPETGKFCRSCGTNLSGVSEALTSNPTAERTWSGMMEPTRPAGRLSRTENETRRRSDPTEVYGDAIKAILSGFGFLIAAGVLFYTGIIGGRSWWWAMLFPAFTALSKGVADYMKSKKMMQAAGFAATAPAAPAIDQSRPATLTPAHPEWAPSDSRYKTGDLVPPSVTENTTRHLGLDNEGQTITLPKKV